MPGYRHNKADQLNALQDLLRDRYHRGDGSITILKELLQNADDAKAKKQILGGLLAEGSVQLSDVLRDLVRSDQLLPVLAQLAYVEQVEVCQWEGEGFSRKAVHRIGSAAGRLTRPIVGPSQNQSFSFSIFRSPDDELPAVVRGAWCQRDTDRLEEIRSGDWPTRYRSDGQLHSSAEKAVGHAGITLLRYVPKDGRPQLFLRWAVFLPFEPMSLGSLEGEESVEILLHGYFSRILPGASSPVSPMTTTSLRGGGTRHCSRTCSIQAASLPGARACGSEALPGSRASEETVRVRILEGSRIWFLCKTNIASNGGGGRRTLGAAASRSRAGSASRRSTSRCSEKNRIDRLNICHGGWAAP